MNWYEFASQAIDKVEELFEIKDPKDKSSRFIQYIHKNGCGDPCGDCLRNDARLFERNDPNLPKVGRENHFGCHCEYRDVPSKKVGTISQMGLNAPDVYLKAYGQLPDYYITKQVAREQYGWNDRRNTVAGKAPGKMIGGEIYTNKQFLLPIKDGRIWYECDVDYTSGGRSAKRLFYSNDGLMFYSDDHGTRSFYFIE